MCDRRPTDTQLERWGLHADVFPFMAELCRRVGLEFAPTDLRWGVGEEATREPRASALFLAEIARCAASRVAPQAIFFLAVLGDKV